MVKPKIISKKKQLDGGYIYIIDFGEGLMDYYFYKGRMSKKWRVSTEGDGFCREELIFLESILRGLSS